MEGKTQNNSQALKKTNKHIWLPKPRLTGAWNAKLSHPLTAADITN